ncbi:hypothetical protein OUZ56_017086 [Daphnia magna]|uniref:Arrestin-like N-terminal domain-containing protein n=1 Tax=Daphnia magna TaxID=35525 RepID=A0ABR0AS50_9CRUS|nr:hypothetical protein OUZ56_017086 [Daphnia magna]
MNSCPWSSHRNLCEKLACNEVELWFQSCIMGIESLTIELDNPVGIYFPGEEVSGVVHISNVSRVYLECQGYAKFCFNELSSETYYSAEDTYLDLKIPLITNEGRETFELVSGVHQFPFVFVLPKKSPLHFKLRCWKNLAMAMSNTQSK